MPSARLLVCVTYNAVERPYLIEPGNYGLWYHTVMKRICSRSTEGSDTAYSLQYSTTNTGPIKIKVKCLRDCKILQLTLAIICKMILQLILIKKFLHCIYSKENMFQFSRATETVILRYVRASPPAVKHNVIYSCLWDPFGGAGGRSTILYTYD